MTPEIAPSSEIEEKNSYEFSGSVAIRPASIPIVERIRAFAESGIQRRKLRLDSSRRRLGTLAVSFPGEFSEKDLCFTYSCIRRLLDIVFGFVGLIISAPIIALAAIAIRLESRGNPIFVQTRMGLGGRPFKMIKLRGMFVNSRDRFPELYDYSRHRNLSFHFHYQNDPRITRVGAFLRRTSIDELPNFINVITGDMTLVGPRPEIPEVIALYGPYAAKYLSVKPGVTCLSKITGRDRLTKEDTIKMDLGYVDRMSLWLDLKILLATFICVVLRRNVFF